MFNKLKKTLFYIKQVVFSRLDKIRQKRRNGYVKHWRKSLQNKDFTLISNNCNGCVLLSELGVRFNSQFVNLFLNADDYIEYLKNFDYYNNQELEFIDSPEQSYPVARIGSGVVIHFVHYKTKEEAHEKWEERKKRINNENLFVMFTEQRDCTREHVEEFDALPFENKVAFTYNKYEKLNSTVYLSQFKAPLGVHMFLDFKNHFSYRRKYDIFDFVSWFNGEKDLKKLLRK